jgi:hypothetical protein
MELKQGLNPLKGILEQQGIKIKSDDSKDPPTPPKKDKP